MESRLIIIGAGGHGRVVADIARQNGYENIAFLDDNIDCRCEVLDSTDAYGKYLHDSCFFVAIGNNSVRQKYLKILIDEGAKVVSLIHPSAIVAVDVKIGYGTVVMAGAVINTGAKLGDGVIVNTCASVDHDCGIGDFVHIAVGAHVCGTVQIGDRTWIGAGATVINNVSICRNCMIGAGAVVVGSIAEEGTYVGVPARRNE